MERADLVTDGEEERGLVVPGRARRLAPHHEEAGDVVGAVLDTLPQDGHAVDAARQLARDGGGARILRHPLGGDRRRRRLDRLRVGEVPVEPRPALPDGLWMRVAPLDLAELPGAGPAAVV